MFNQDFSYNNIKFIGVFMQVKRGPKEKSTDLIPFIDNDSKQTLNGIDRASEIALSAYYKSETRGYEPGHELQDWLEAEAEVSKLCL